MSPLSDSRTQAAACTALAAAAILAWLLLATLKFDELSLSVPPRPVAEIVEQEEEFVDFLDMAYGPSDPAPAYTPEPQNHESKAAEASGIDKIDAGEPAPPAPDVVSERPSPIQRPKKEIPPQTGPDLKKQAEEEARRKARKGVGDAFKNTSPTPDNTSNAGVGKGDSGKPDGVRSDANGTGHGTVGGGWSMPSYAAVPSEDTGSIILKAVVGRDGTVRSVELVGGKSPAAANSALVQACMAEVRRRKFTRHDDDAPESATARITYTFK